MMRAQARASGLKMILLRACGHNVAAFFGTERIVETCGLRGTLLGPSCSWPTHKDNWTLRTDCWCVKDEGLSVCEH
jgi:hypothetical protein